MNELVLVIGQKKLRWSFLSAMTFLFFTYTTFVRFLGFLGFNSTIAAGVMLGLQGLAFLGHVFTKRTVTWDAVVLYFLIALVFLITSIEHPEYLPYLNGSMSEGKYEVFSSVFRFGRGIYAYYIIRQYQDRSDELFKVLKAVAVCMLLNIRAIFMMDSGYSMDFGYQMEMVALIFMAEYLNPSREVRKKSTVFSLLISLAAIMLGIVFGSRACVIGYAVFIILTLFFKGRPNGRQVAVVTLALAAVLVITSSTMTTLLYEALKAVGIDSRTILKMSQGQLTTDNARQLRIWPTLMEVVQKSSFLHMHGAYADRYYLLGRYVYAHNIAIEMLLTFGKCLGGLILLAILIQTLQTWRRNKDMTGVLTILFGSFAIARLWFSNSFWYEPSYWAFLALLFNARLEWRRMKHKTICEVVI